MRRRKWFSCCLGLFVFVFQGCCTEPLFAARLLKASISPWNYNYVTLHNVSQLDQTVEVTFTSISGNISAGSTIACGASVTCTNTTSCKTLSSKKVLQPGKSLCLAVYDDVVLSENYPLDSGLNIDIRVEEDRGAITAEGTKHFEGLGHNYLMYLLNAGRPF
jgi:hypothetical protein